MNGMMVVSYLAAGVLFIRSLGGLSKQETAQQGNVLGMVGMVVAVAITLWAWFTRESALDVAALPVVLLAAATLIGGAIGAGLARRVEMTGMPELVAVLHSFVGL
ncbi:MAG: NAD(P)(+) transhydrogenase (Re/Si-specific) subunit beta, partial [Archangium sp.]|nr:NAD(P)(+) transhydrogenase (Re/Si-specific) subunit beta [Archangium sp.]